LQAQLTQGNSRSQALEKKLGCCYSAQRLYLAKIDKLQHQQKGVLTTISQLQGQVAAVAKPAAVEVDRSMPLKFAATVPKPVTRVYIDGNNLNFAIAELPIEINYQALQIELSRMAQTTTFKYYMGLREEVSEGQRRFMEYLGGLRYEVVTLPVVYRSNSDSFKTVGDDVRLAIDMLGEVNAGDRVILVSGDGDFGPVVEAVQRRGALVTVVGKRGMLSQQLAAIANELVLLDDIQDRIARYTKLNVA
jgi:uncharacterized LabA/DUF88 family protein